MSCCSHDEFRLVFAKKRGRCNIYVFVRPSTITEARMCRLKFERSVPHLKVDDGPGTFSLPSATEIDSSKTLKRSRGAFITAVLSVVQCQRNELPSRLTHTRQWLVSNLPHCFSFSVRPDFFFFLALLAYSFILNKVAFSGVSALRGRPPEFYPDLTASVKDPKACSGDPSRECRRNVGSR